MDAYAGSPKIRRIRSRSQKTRRGTVAARVAVAEKTSSPALAVVPQIGELLGAPAEKPARGRGRPRAFVPQLILDYATAWFLKTGSVGQVLEQLQREGLGKFPRNTLKRALLRRKAELDVQNSDPSHY